jgi:hypothetical protein
MSAILSRFASRRARISGDRDEFERSRLAGC